MLASISTHTPLAGSDELYAHRIPGLIFISTHTPLAGSDGTFYNYNLTIYPFQPTLPSRGVTIRFHKVTITDLISTHTPLAGSDAEG